MHPGPPTRGTCLLPLPHHSHHATLHSAPRDGKTRVQHRSASRIVPALPPANETRLSISLSFSLSLTHTHTPGLQSTSREPNTQCRPAPRTLTPSLRESAIRAPTNLSRSNALRCVYTDLHAGPILAIGQRAAGSGTFESCKSKVGSWKAGVAGKNQACVCVCVCVVVKSYNTKSRTGRRGQGSSHSDSE
jgi:hypothetical protein